MNMRDGLTENGQPLHPNSTEDAFARLGETSTKPDDSSASSDAAEDSAASLKAALSDPATNADLASGMQDAKKHPRDMRVDERRNAMSALARKRWEKARAAKSSGGRDLARNNPENSQHAELTGWPAERDQIIAALRRKAEAGDVGAAREYRAWLETFGQEHNEGMSVEELGQLDPHMRARMAEALTQWIEGQEDAAGDPKAATTRASGDGQSTDMVF
jgi:hypothetical protein